MKIVYVGPAESVWTSTPAGTFFFVHGEPVDVPKEQAEKFLEQTIFTTPKTPKESK